MVYLYNYWLLGRMEKLAKFINDTEINLKKIMAFCLRIPGFRSLSGDDRMGIIKRKFLAFLYVFNSCDFIGGP